MNQIIATSIDSRNHTYWKMSVFFIVFGETCVGMLKGFEHVMIIIARQRHPSNKTFDINDLSASISALTFVWKAKHSVCHHSCLCLMDLHEIWFHASDRGPHTTDKSKTQGHHAAIQNYGHTNHCLLSELIFNLSFYQLILLSLISLALPSLLYCIVPMLWLLINY